MANRPTNTIPLLSALGTYDIIYGRYASVESVKSEVISWDTLEYYTLNVGGKEYQVPRGFNALLDNRKTYEASYGKSSSEYSRSLTSHTGIEGEYSFFSGSVTADFDDDERKSLSNAFTKISYNVPLYILRLPVKARIRDILTPEFCSALDDGDPNDLYKHYGTHLVNSIKVGGRARFLYVTNTIEYSSETSLKVAVEASVKSLMGKLDAQQQIEYKEAIKSVQESSTYKIITEGGDPKYGSESFLDQIGDWAGSIIDWPAFIDFGSRPNLLPLYELVTGRRRQLLEEAYKAYCRAAPSLGIDGPYLEVRPFKFDQIACSFVWNDTEGKEHVVRTYCPATIDDDWYYVSQSVGNQDGIVVRELVHGALAKPVESGWTGYEVPYQQHRWRREVWRGRGPTDDYVVLSAVAAYPYLISKATVTDKLRAVHKSALKPGKYGQELCSIPMDSTPTKVWLKTDQTGGMSPVPFWEVTRAHGPQKPLQDPWVMATDRRKVKLVTK